MKLKPRREGVRGEEMALGREKGGLDRAVFVVLACNRTVLQIENPPRLFELSVTTNACCIFQLCMYNIIHM